MLPRFSVNFSITFLLGISTSVPCFEIVFQLFPLLGIVEKCLVQPNTESRLGGVHTKTFQQAPGFVGSILCNRKLHLLKYVSNVDSGTLHRQVILTYACMHDLNTHVLVVLVHQVLPW